MAFPALIPRYLPFHSPTIGSHSSKIRKFWILSALKHSNNLSCYVRQCLTITEDSCLLICSNNTSSLLMLCSVVRANTHSSATSPLYSKLRGGDYTYHLSLYSSQPAEGCGNYLTSPACAPRSSQFSLLGATCVADFFVTRQLLVFQSFLVEILILSFF